jgi:hypothetical protein
MSVPLAGLHIVAVFYLPREWRPLVATVALRGGRSYGLAYRVARHTSIATLFVN